MMITFKTVLGFLFMLLVATIAVLAVVCYENNGDAVKSSLMVTHTHEVIENADEISDTYKETRLAVNSIIIRDDTSRYSAYVAAMNRLSSYVHELRQLTADNNHQQVNIDSLEEAMKHFRNVSDSLVGMVIAKLPQSAIRNVFSNSKALRDDVTLKIDFIKNTEKVLLAQREAANLESVSSFNRAFIFLLIGIGFLLVTTFLVIRYNFNKRIRMEKELSRTNALFEKIFYDSPIAIVISDLDTGEILNCNKVFASVVNIESRELLGKTAAELGIFQNKEKRNKIVAVGTENGIAPQGEVYIKPRGREPIYVSVHAHVIHLPDRTCLLTAILDLTTHKRAQDEIEKAFQTERELNRLKSNFVTLASHEFKTPLTTILSSAFILDKYSFGENQEKAKKHLARIKSTVNSMSSILDEFLSVAEIEEGYVQPKFERVDLPSYVTSICNNLQTFAKPGQIIYYSHSGRNEVNADPVLLANILTNLISNSIKYSVEDCPIHVTSAVNSRIELSVKDNGIGIPEEDQKHLFERFYRASNAGNVQGTGLGLHILKHYVEMMNGSVDLKSEVGKGTEVKISLEPARVSHIEGSSFIDG